MRRIIPPSFSSFFSSSLYLTFLLLSYHPSSLNPNFSFFSLMSQPPFSSLSPSSFLFFTHLLSNAWPNPFSTKPPQTPTTTTTKSSSSSSSFLSNSIEVLKIDQIRTLHRQPSHLRRRRARPYNRSSLQGYQSKRLQKTHKR